MSMFDITKVAASETGVIELKRGDDSPLTDDKGNILSVTVHGPGSKVYRAAEAKRERARLERLRKNGGRVEALADTNAEAQAEFLAACTISFNGWTYPTADKLEGEAMFRAAYLDPALGFIRDHVFEQINDWSHFTKGSAKS